MNISSLSPVNQVRLGGEEEWMTASLSTQLETTSMRTRLKDEIIGSSSNFHWVLKQDETVAPTRSAVLIQGETGTGKARKT
jgi:transcriptional regulator with GAF, ATPase, and Fis domain